MPTLRFLAPLLALLLIVPAPTEAQTNVQDAFRKGVALFNQENYAEALVLFDAVIKAKPDFVYARSYAAKCRTALASNQGPKNDIEGQLAKLVLPEINFTDAPIGDVLNYLTTRAEELSKGEVVPNFIYKGTPEQRQGTTLSLSMRNVPMTDAIKYIGQLTRTRFIYEEHAIVADPNYQDAVNEAAKKAAEAAAAAEPNPVFGNPTKNIFE